jgi:hypothetical protein
MRRESQIMRLARKVGGFLSTFLVILTLVLSSVTVAEVHEAPHQTKVIAVAIQLQAPANCHFYASCTVFVVPSNLALVTAAALHRLRFLPPEAILLAALNPMADTPPPRV